VLWEQLGSPSEFLRIPFGQATFHLFRGEFDLAQRLAEDLLSLGRERNDATAVILAHQSLARNLMLVGKFALSRSHLKELLALSDPISRRLVESRALLGFVLLCLGFPDQALAASTAAIAEARRLAHPASLAASLMYSARVHSLLGDDEALCEQAHELVRVTTEQAYPYWRAQGTIYCGWVKVKSGEVSDGMSLLRSGSTDYRAAGTEMAMPHQIALLAGACEIAGRIEEAVNLYDEALQIVERPGERWFAAELFRHKGQLLLRRGHTDAAEGLYRRALGIAAEQEAKLWELRAAVSLARLRRDQGHPTEARDLLAPVYGWFTEGFDTPDLKEAKGLLDELG
jgi:predicted ATPase